MWFLNAEGESADNFPLENALGYCHMPLVIAIVDRRGYSSGYVPGVCWSRGSLRAIMTRIGKCVHRLWSGRRDKHHEDMEDAPLEAE